MESRAAVARVFWRRNTGPDARYMPNTGVPLLRVLLYSRTDRMIGLFAELRVVSSYGTSAVVQF